MRYLEFAQSAHAQWVYEEQRGVLRKGQFYFNYLHKVRPDLSRQIQMTDLNPYHNSSRLDAMLGWLINNWHLKLDRVKDV